MARKPNTETSTANLGFEQKLWLTADKLRNNMDAAEYKHVVLGLIFPGACLKIAWGPAARDFGRGQGGEAGASPQRAVTTEPTPATGKRPAARRGFVENAGWLRCSSVGDRCGYPPSLRLAIQPFPRKQDSHGIFRPAPEYISDTAGKYRMSNAEVRVRNPWPIRHSKFVLRHLPPPAEARWSHLQGSAKLPTIGKLVDDAMVAIERDNPRLKGVLPKDYARPGLDKQRPQKRRSPDRRAGVAGFATTRTGRRPNP